MDIVPIHDDLLASAGSYWHDWRAFNPDWTTSNIAEDYKQKLLAILQADFASSRLFLVKDPRICRFVPVWRDILQRFDTAPHVVLPIRNPLEVAASLKERDGFLPGKSCLLWLRHVLDAELTTRDLPRALVTYDLLVEDWRQVVEKIGSNARISWPRRSDQSNLEIDRFVSTRLRHHTIDPTRLSARADIVDWIKTTYRVLCEMAAGHDNEPHRAQLDQVRAAFDKGSSAFGALLAEEAVRTAEAQNNVTRLGGELDSLRHEAIEHTRDREQLSASLEEARAIAGRTGQQAATLAGELEAAKAADEAKRQDVARLSRELEGARKFLRDSQTEVQRLAGELDGILQNARRQTEELEAARRELDERDQRIGDLSGKLEATLEEASELEVRVTQALQETAGKSEALDQSRHEVNQLREALGQHGQKIAEDHAEHGRHRQQIDELSGKLQAAAREEQGLHTRITEAQQDAANKSQALAESRAEQQRHRRQIDDLSGKLHAADGAASHAETERARLDRDLTVARGEAKGHAAKTAGLERDLSAARALLGELRGQTDDPTHTAEAAWPSARWRKMAKRLWSSQARIRAARQWEYDLIRKSKLFDALWYLKRYPDVAAAGDDPLWHYILHGSAEGRDPHPLFDGKWYLTRPRDDDGMSALAHYLSRGAARGLDPHPLFDTDWYLAQNPDVAVARINPLYHFWKIGATRGLDPHPLFDTSWYIERNPDVSQAGDNALVHYLMHGWKEGRNPHPLFDSRQYLQTHPEIANGSTSPLADYLLRNAVSAPAR